MDATSELVGDRGIVITRIVHAPRARVWEVCTTPEHIDRWWGPDGFTNRTLHMEVRVGGQWKYTMTAADGTVFPSLITYTEVSPIDRLAYDHGDWDDPKHFEASLTFTDVPEGTLVTLRTVFPSKEARDLVVERYGAIEGGKQTLAHLDRYASELHQASTMSHPIIFNFLTRADDRTITVERSFNAPLEAVWSAWTEAEVLCKWWAPKPYACMIRSLDFREGGRWLYCMEGPQGDRHWCLFDYETIRPKTYFAGSDAFCDEHGVANAIKPRVRWEAHFQQEEARTLVRVILHFATQEDLEQLVQMGFKEGFTMGLDQLDELLSA